ncbi:Cytochrome C biogenesis protein transmembrane region [Corynebacterium felinum]|nr:Cytochrome C biogenesis protein transmembrane region [Corynebacterium felinum]
MVDIGILGAFLGGVLALLSPCSALLLPAFFAYAFDSTTKLIARTGVFFLGLAAILVPIGMGAGSIGGYFNAHRDTLITVGGGVIIVMGFITFFGGGFSLGPTARMKGQSYLSTFFLGALYGFSGFCAGPLLGAVLTTAIVGGSSSYGAFILGMYALGMTVPLFVLAAVWDKWNISQRKFLRGVALQLGPLRLNSTSMISGALLIIVGGVFLFSHGTSGIPGLLSIDTQAHIQEWVVRYVGPLSDVLTLLGLAVICAVFLIVHILRNPSPADADKECDRLR